jgi:hypothetical protein
VPRICVSIVFACLISTNGLYAQEVATHQVEFKTQAGTTTSICEVLVAYADGSMLLLTPDGQLRTLTSTEVVTSVPVDEAMEPLDSKAAAAAVLAELPPGFDVHETDNYVLVYNTNFAYVKWVGVLFERLNSVFTNYWKKSNDLKLQKPRFPLVAIVFRDKASYLAYAERDVGDSAKAMIGYYNMKTNRMVTYDLTGVVGTVPPGKQVQYQELIDSLRQRPEFERTLSTIVHEAAHQLSFNTGLQTRLADSPLWMSEGMAMFFESPDNASAKGGQRIGNVNYFNLNLFRQSMSTRPADSLTTLITDDARFRDAATATKAYPESWALTYFLFKTKKKQTSAYLTELAEFAPLGEVTARERLELFKKHFGDDLARLDQEFISYMRRL